MAACDQRADSSLLLGLVQAVGYECVLEMVEKCVEEEKRQPPSMELRGDQPRSLAYAPSPAAFTLPELS
jgi:hypothetical protein